MKIKNIASLIVFLFPLAGYGSSAKSKDSFNLETRKIMNLVYNSMAEVVPLSFDPDLFKDRKNQKEILKKLEALSQYGVELGKLGMQGENGFKYMSKTFSVDVQQIFRWYKEGDYEGARFYIHQVMDDCVQCHSKLPADTNFQASSSFFKNIAVNELQPLEKARVYIATRNFDNAIKTYEDYFVSQEGIMEGYYSKGAFLDYLKVTIRVKEDLQGPINLFEKLLTRKDVPTYLVRLMKSWISDLKNLQKKGFLTNISVKEAEALINEGKRQMAFSTDRVSLINYMAASSILQKIVRNEKLETLQKAEAYYLLGVTESLLEHSFWVSESKHFYETSIRMAPKSLFAKKAYALLEEQVILEYTGSKGVNVPSELDKWLKELKKLVE